MVKGGFALSDADEPLARPEGAGSLMSASGRVAAELRHLLGESVSAAAEAGEVDSPSFAEWAETIATAKGREFDLDRFPYQRQIFEVFGDESVPEAVLMKCVQIGASELMVRQLLYFALSRPLTVMYIFPAERQLTDFRNDRIEPLIKANPASR